MKLGDVLLASLPQADGKVKARPVLWLASVAPFGDLLVCGISTQLRHEVKGFDECIVPEDDDFPGSGLKATSLIRLGYLSVLVREDILCRIGAVSPARLKRLLERMANHFDELAKAVSETEP